MSHVVGEVTYVELFKDGEGKSRVSVGDSALSVRFTRPPQHHYHVLRDTLEPIYCRSFDLGTVC